MTSQPLEKAPRSSAYSDDQYADNYPPGAENHWWTRARAEIVFRAVAGFRHQVVLDVGCGPGLTVAFLRDKGMDCWGCELGRPMVLPAARDFVLTGTDARNVGAELQAKVGVVLLLDVLEHLEDPRAFLEALLPAFPNLRHVIVTVPARAELWSGWDERYGHHRRYDRQSLVSLLADAGLLAPRARYVFQSLYPALFVAAKTGSRPTKMGSPQPVWLHRLIASWFSAEARLPWAGAVAGTSLLAVCDTKAK